MNEGLLDAFRRRIIHSQLEDGTRVCIRSIMPADEPLMREGIEQLSMESRYLRFFSGQPMPPDRVIRRLVDADGSRHIAWGAILTDNDLHPAIGAVHAVRPGEDIHSAEFSIAIIDSHQGLGLARMLIAVLLVNCHLAAIASLDVQILSENQAARRLVMSLGAERHTSQYSVTEYTIDVPAALETLRNGQDTRGLRDIFAALAPYL